MKKVFLTTMSVIAAAAMMMLVSCKKDNGTDNNNGNEQAPETVDEELVGTWTITGEAQGWAADGGVAMTESNNVWTATNVPVKGEGFKFVKDGSWNINLGAVETRATLTYDDGAEILLEKGAANIAGSKGDGYYDITLNLLKKTATIKFVKEIENEAPEAGEVWHPAKAINFSKTSMWTLFDEDVALSSGYTYVFNFMVLGFNDNTYLAKFSDKKPQGANCNNQVRFGEVSGHTPQMEWAINNGARLETTTVFEAETWYSVALVAESTGNRHIYVNGVEEALKNISNEAIELTDGVLPTAYQHPGIADAKFGAIEWGDSWGTSGYLDSVRPFPGCVCNISIWSRALSADEVAALVSAAPAAKADGLVAYWPMDEGTGYVIADKSGAGKVGDVDFSKGWTDRYDASSNPAATTDIDWMDVTE